MLLRWYQSEAVDGIFDFFAKHQGYDVNGLPVPANPIVALPTGTGKSVVIATFLERVFRYYPQTRALVLTHVKKLIEQNAKQMLRVWPSAPIGINSSGLKQRDYLHPIIFAGIQSIYKHGDLLGYRDFVIIDEAHLVGDSQDASYAQLIFDLMYGEHAHPNDTITVEQFRKAEADPNCNPWLKVIMLSATPFRSGMGCLTNGKYATGYAYNLCTIEGFERLIADGYLCPPVCRATTEILDVSKVKSNNIDYIAGELDKAVNQKDITYRALKELVEASFDRRCGLIFAVSIDHAENIRDMMCNVFGEECVCIHSRNGNEENDEALQLWLDGKVKWAVNMNALTTGVDKPEVDIIGMLRPSRSAVLWVQAVGRGTRCVYADGYDLSDFNQRHLAIQNSGKTDCLVLDFAGNTKTLGPINDPLLPYPKGKKSMLPREQPVKICPHCNTYNHVLAKTCFVCQTDFPKGALGISAKPSALSLLRNSQPVIESFAVHRVVYSAHVSKKSGQNSIKVSYYCSNLKTFYEWVTVEGKVQFDGTIKHSYASKKGRQWCRQRIQGEPPPTNDLLLQYNSYLRVPVSIQVWTNRQYPEIMSVEF